MKSFLNRVRRLNMSQRPSGGWIRAIRISLGMSLKQLANRAEMSIANASRIERHEKSGSVTLKTMERIARAMDSEFVYAIVPKDDIDKIIELQRKHYLNKRIRNTMAHMSLEDQALSDNRVREMMTKLNVDKKRIWDD